MTVIRRWLVRERVSNAIVISRLAVFGSCVHSTPSSKRDRFGKAPTRKKMLSGAPSHTLTDLRTIDDTTRTTAVITDALADVFDLLLSFIRLC